MKRFLSIFSQFIFLYSSAQVPGYMGKRFSLEYSNYFSPSLLNPTASVSEQGSLGLNTTHCVNAEYSIKMRTNFCLGVQFFKTGVHAGSNYTATYYDNGYSNTNNVDYKPSSDLPMQLKTTNISLGFKFFRPGFIAPIGKYQKLEFIFLLDKVSYERSAFYLHTSPPSRINLGAGEYDFKSAAIALTFGRQRVLFNSIIIDSGFRFGVSTNAVFSFIKDDLLDDSYGLPFEDQLKTKVNQRIFAAQLFSFHLGIGFLAF
jgi:hypothetical protein